jgi:hypothetical protein
LGSSPRKFSDFASLRQDFQRILKRISLEIAVFLGLFRNKAISFTFPSIFRNFLQISFRFEFPNNFLQLVQISFKKEISLKMEALESTKKQFPQEVYMKFQTREKWAPLT